MTAIWTRRVAIGLLATIATACTKDQTASSGTAEGEQKVATGAGLQPVVNGEAKLSDAAKGFIGISKPDYEFMTGMVHHHAQAIVMAKWAPTHGASDALKRMCERIVVGQGDEIALMRGWLYDHGQPMPDATATKMKMNMNGVEHDMLMPGMLTDEQMAALDKARGRDFDRLFLEGMIQHHQGAISMVTKLFDANAGQEETVFKFATDVYADQSTEINIMKSMLAKGE